MIAFYGDHVIKLDSGPRTIQVLISPCFEGKLLFVALRGHLNEFSAEYKTLDMFAMMKA